MSRTKVEADLARALRASALAHTRIAAAAGRAHTDRRSLDSIGRAVVGAARADARVAGFALLLASEVVS